MDCNWSITAFGSDVQDGGRACRTVSDCACGIVGTFDSARTITGTDDLAGRTVCVAREASPGVRNLVAEDVTVSRRDTYPQCETALMIGQADAIAADDAIAAGLASKQGEAISQGRRRNVRRTFVRDRNKSRQSTLAATDDAALQSMMDDGSWKQGHRQDETVDRLRSRHGRSTLPR